MSEKKPRTYRDLRLTFPDRRNWTLPWVLRHRASTHGDRVYLDVPFQSAKLTYAETLDAAERIGGALLAGGCEPGDRVLIMAPNCLEYVLAWFGSMMAGLVEVPINTAYRGSFLEHQVRTVAPTAAVVDAAFVPHFLEIEAAKAIRTFYVLGEADEAIARLREAGWAAEPFTALTSAERPAQLPEVAYNDLAAILFTSGTTGLSKGVEMPHAHFYFFADECVSLCRLTDADAHMAVGPLFHGNAQFLAAYPAMIVGARFVLQQKFSASRWVDQLRESQVTVTNFIGVMMDWVYKQPRRPDDADNPLRCLYAVPLATSIAADFKERFGIEAFVENFGLTEIAMPILTPYGEERPPGAAGLLVEDYFDVRLVDPETDEEVPVGEVGELVVRAHLPYTMTTGYYNMPERTVEAQRNLWFHTGDGLRRDAEGWYYFVDRLKDALRRRGENISSFEIEQPILGHPDVVDCAAVGVPADAEAGEDELMVVVVPREGATLTAEDVWEWCEKRLPAFCVPRYVRIVDALPMTPSGKVRKAELRAAGTAGAADREGDR
ncbi:crotonobetaine/carnitine-CoA ligase [Pseudonocardia thermophila]|jgi:Acyl-CoA synthetases (AMP-forming)/AMP-acid ligases II|uniref:Crotonobetaine/carnitine-CoA ligase n=1 Tax=Pseudonocardia thermophila TaxID=1848 RepID=A0A1M6T663_PSETH|nr:AMP-binding protein [Pseudonocardia thermophila]SHK52532.1 crotonobetaine/carnitine-CoA ligase [Pseudonocardia thermophila]